MAVISLPTAGGRVTPSHETREEGIRRLLPSCEERAVAAHPKASPNLQKGVARALAELELSDERKAPDVATSRREMDGTVIELETRWAANREALAARRVMHMAAA